MSITLSLQADALSDEALQAFARDLCRTLNRETDVRATLAERPAEPGARGAEVLLATIVLPFLKETAVEIILRVLLVYVERNPALRRLIFKGEGGRELALTRDNMQPDQLQQTIDRVRDFTSGARP